MGKGWDLVARLGGVGARYPHVLVDSHGWCLRLGPKSRLDDKYFSSLPSLLQGLVEHGARRRLPALSSELDPKEFRREALDAIRSGLGLCLELLEQGGREEHLRRREVLHAGQSTPSSAPLVPVAQSGGQALESPAPKLQAG